MKKTVRCFISCILPCGALDVIRIVHSNGRVEEISGSFIKACDIMKAHPKHVLKKPSSPSDDVMVVPKIVIVPPDAELRRGKIYFLMPEPAAAPSTPKKTRSKSTNKKKKRASLDSTTNNSGNSLGHSRQHRRSRSMSNANANKTINNNNNKTISMTNPLISDEYLSEILSETFSTTQRDRRRGRVGVWRPHLESIYETPNDG